MRWVYDKDCDGTFMVYDNDDPDTDNVVARGIKSEDDARLIAAAPDCFRALHLAREGMESHRDGGCQPQQWNSELKAADVALAKSASVKPGELMGSSASVSIMTLWLAKYVSPDDMDVADRADFYRVVAERIIDDLKAR